MRIARVEIRNWRNLEGVSFSIPDDCNLVCLVGENGTGKSNILELIAAVADMIGLTRGFDSQRGNPFGEDHDLSVTLTLPKEPEKLFGPRWTEMDLRKAGWSGKITISSVKRAGQSNGPIFEFSDLDPSYLRNHRPHDELKQVLAGNADTLCLLLDSDRAYPQVGIGGHEFHEIIARDWDSEQWRKARAYQRAITLYGEWLRYLLARESQEGGRLLKVTRAATEAKQTPPPWIDHFDSYRVSLSEVLPHLRFAGVDQQRNKVLFDGAGVSLDFHQLSGGEREIAFLVGQVLRFGLERGLFLIDEPELHLNPRAKCIEQSCTRI